jgi:hypothetical protein
MNQRQTDDYWQAYWGERFKSENEGYQHRTAALEARLALVTAALQRAHDVLDDTNAANDATAYCLWCNGKGYDGTGLKHDDDCILVQIRALNSTKAGS